MILVDTHDKFLSIWLVGIQDKKPRHKLNHKLYQTLRMLVLILAAQKSPCVTHITCEKVPAEVSFLKQQNTVSLELLNRVITSSFHSTRWHIGIQCDPSTEMVSRLPDSRLIWSFGYNPAQAFKPSAMMDGAVCPKTYDQPVKSRGLPDTIEPIPGPLRWSLKERRI